MSEHYLNIEGNDHNETDAIWALAGDIEEFACRFDEAYANETGGSFELRRKIGDREGTFKKKILVEAERIYTNGELYLTNYKVSECTRYFNLSMHSFPEDIWEIISNDVMVDVGDVDEDVPQYAIDEDWLNELGDEETEFAIEFEYSHIITSDGAIFTDHEIRAKVNDRLIPLPQDRYDDAPVSRDVASEENQAGLKEFMGMFDPEDLKVFQGIGEAALQELTLADVTLNVYAEMKRAQEMSLDEQIERMRQLAAMIFPEFDKEDS